MSSFIEKWAFGLTFAMFFLTAVAVLVAVGYATVHLVRETPTRAELKTEIASVKSEIASVKTELKAEIASVKTELKAELQLMKTEIIAAVRGEIQVNKNNMNSKMIDHVSDLHAKDNH